MKKTILNGLILVTCTGFISANEYSFPIFVDKELKAQKIIVAQIFEPAEEIVEAEIIDSMEISSENESFSESDGERLSEKQTTRKRNYTISENDKILAEEVKKLEIGGIKKKTNEEWNNLARQLKEKDPRTRGFMGLRNSLYNLMLQPTLEKEEQEIYRQLSNACHRIYMNDRRNKKRSNDRETVQERSAKKRRLDPEGAGSKPKRNSMAEKEAQKESMDTEIVPAEEIDLRKLTIKKKNLTISASDIMLAEQIKKLEIGGIEKKTNEEWNKLAKKLKENDLRDRGFMGLRNSLYNLMLQTTLKKEEQEIYCQLSNACHRIYMNDRRNKKRSNDGEIVQERSAKKPRLDPEGAGSKPKERPLEEKDIFDVGLLSGSKAFLPNQDIGLNNNSNMDLAFEPQPEPQSIASPRIELEKEMSDKTILDYMEIIQYMELNPWVVAADEQEVGMDTKLIMPTEIILSTEKNFPQDRVPPTFFESAENIALQGPYKSLVEILREYPIKNIKEKTKSDWENLAVEIQGKDVKKRTFPALRHVFDKLKKNLSANDEKEICHQLSKACQRIRVSESLERFKNDRL